MELLVLFSYDLRRILGLLNQIIGYPLAIPDKLWSTHGKVDIPQSLPIRELILGW